MPWYERYDERLQRELQALSDAGISFEEDQDAKDKGILKLRLHYAWNSETYELDAVYPDLFPYAPPEVNLEGTPLRRHWNPNGGNLCLIGRESIQWDVNSTLADLISERLPDILQFHSQGDEAQIRAVETPQGEPVSEYFNGGGVRNSYALFDGSWMISEDVAGGWIEAVGFYRKVEDGPKVPCFIVKRIADQKNRTLCEWVGPPLDSHWGNGASYRIPWVRMDPAPTGSTKEIGDAYMSGTLGIKKANISGSVRQAYFAVVYNEEVQQFEQGLGLSIFELLHVPKLDTVELRAIRTFRCGESDLAARIPSVAALSGKRVLLCGAGALGSRLAMELARNGIAHLDLVDFDYLEPATARRWLAGLEEFGKDKPEAIAEIVKRQYPWTSVSPLGLRIGGTRPADGPDQFDQIVSLISSADCVLDMTAEVTVNQILADMSAWTKKPFVLANATPGGWGGMVYQCRPNQGDACWMCMRTYLYPESEHLPVSDPVGLLQPPGCAARTFTGTSFDLAEIVNEAMRMTSGILGPEYPSSNWQLGICDLRTNEGARIPPRWRSVEIAPREGCACQG